MGLILSSLARSFEASSHSFEIVLGGAGAVCSQGKKNKTQFESFKQERDGTRTDRAYTTVDQSSAGDKDTDASSDFDSGSGWVNRCAWTMWTKSNIIR